MRCSRFWLVVAMLLVPSAAWADGHRAIFFGLSFSNGSLLTGVHGTFDAGPGDRVAIVGDLSWHTGDGTDRTMYAAGLRFLPGYARKTTSRHLVSVHALVGGARESGDNSAVFGGGAAYEAVLRRTATARVSLRIQGDVFGRTGALDSFGRFSVLLGGRW